MNKNKVLNTFFRVDGWKNIFTKMGFNFIDKKTGSFVESIGLSQAEVEDLYAGDSNARKIVDLIPQEGLREWIRFTAMNFEEQKVFQAKINALYLKEKLELAWIYARLYGDGMILLSVSDDLPLSAPLDISRVTSLNALTVMHRYILTPDTTNIDADISSPNFGKPVYYTLNTSDASQNGEKIHYTRFIRIVGMPLPPAKFKDNNYWNDSVLSSLFDELEGFSKAHNSVSKIIEEFKIGILKIEDAGIDIAATDGEKYMANRIQAFDMGKSCMKTAIIAKDEEYVLTSPNITNLDKLLSKVEQRLIASSGYPHTLIMGDSPTGGLNGAGDSENRNFYDKVASLQTRILKPILDIIFEILATEGENTDYVFNKLWQLDDAETAKIRESIAKADDIYLGHGVITPQEVAIARFGKDIFGLDLQIDTESRKNNINPKAEGI